MTTFFSDWFYLSIRNTKQIWRPMLALLPSLFIPVFFFAVNSVAFGQVSNIPGFPTGSYKQFIAPVAIFTAIFFSANNGGIELVLDITSGYFKKLTIMPINKLAIIAGKLTEVAIQAVAQGLIVLVLLLAIGIKVQTGLLGTLAIFGILVLFAMAWSCIGMTFALLTQNPRLVQSLFILMFPLLYITTGQMPKELLPDWYATLVAFNPVTHVLEAVRALMNKGWNSPEIWKGFVVVVILFVAMVSITLTSFKKTVK